MSLYDFHDLDLATGEQPHEPAEAMYIDGKTIEDRLPGYRTLTVTGRELLGYNLDTTDVTGRDGTMVNGATLPVRVITVKYQLTAKDDQDFRAKYDQLQAILSPVGLEFYFHDDPVWAWTGTMTSAEIPAEGLNQVVSTFAMTCADPHKHERRAQVRTGTGSVLIRTPMLYPVAPDEIRVKLTAAATGVTIKCGSYTIGLIGSFAAGDVLLIQPAAMEVYLNGAERLDLHDMMTDLENVRVTKGDTISVTPATATLTVTLKGVR